MERRKEGGGREGGKLWSEPRREGRERGVSSRFVTPRWPFEKTKIESVLSGTVCRRRDPLSVGLPATKKLRDEEIILI